MIRHPSFFRVVTTDYTAFSAFIFPLAIAAFYLFLSLTEENPVDLTVPIIFGVSAVIALIVLFWRIQLFNTIFSDGMTATATINKIWFFRDRGRDQLQLLLPGSKLLERQCGHENQKDQTAANGRPGAGDDQSQ